MSEISERCWYAGWMGDTEFQVWRLATEGGSWGVSTALELVGELEAVRTLAEELDRWIVWSGDPTDLEEILEATTKPWIWRDGA